MELQFAPDTYDQWRQALTDAEQTIAANRRMIVTCERVSNALVAACVRDTFPVLRFEGCNAIWCIGREYQNGTFDVELEVMPGYATVLHWHVRKPEVDGRVVVDDTFVLPEEVFDALKEIKS